MTGKDAVLGLGPFSCGLPGFFKLLKFICEGLHIYDPTTWEAEAGELDVQGQGGLHNKIQPIYVLRKYYSADICM